MHLRTWWCRLPVNAMLITTVHYLSSVFLNRFRFHSCTSYNSYLATPIYTATSVALGSSTTMTKTTTHSLASGINNGTFLAATSSSYVDDMPPGGSVSNATVQVFLVLLLTNFIVVSPSSNEAPLQTLPRSPPYHGHHQR